MISKDLHAIGPKSVIPVYTGGNRDPYFNNDGFNPPVPMIVGQTLTLGNLGSYFNDEDGDPIDFSVISSNSSVIFVSHELDWYLDVMGPGDADITIAARDGKGGVGLHKFTVHVDPNTPPTLVKNFYHNYHISPGSSYNLDLSTYFSDPDPADAVAYYTYNVPDSIIEQPISGSTLILDPDMNIASINAYDKYGGKTTEPITVTASTYDPFNSQLLYKNSIYDIDLSNTFGTSAPLEYNFNFAVTTSVYNNSDNHHNYLRINGFLGGKQDIRFNAVDPVANEIYVDTLTITEIFATTDFFITDLVPGVTSISATIDNPNLTVAINGFEVYVSGSNRQSGTLTIIIDGGKEILKIPVTINLV